LEELLSVCSAEAMVFLVSIGYEGNSCAFVSHGEARRWSKFCGGRSNDMSERVRPVLGVKEGLDSARGSLSFRPFRIIATFLVKAGTKSPFPESGVFQVLRTVYEMSIDSVDDLDLLVLYGSRCKVYFAVI
jgi:hypothetical protein